MGIASLNHLFKGIYNGCEHWPENGIKDVTGNRAMGLDKSYPSVFSNEIVIQASLPGRTAKYWLTNSFKKAWVCMGVWDKVYPIGR
jgi:hypothetical protein